MLRCLDINSELGGSMSQAIQIKICRGRAVMPHLLALAQLRIKVFADWPYLYQGDLDYEQNYLRTYAQSHDSVFVLAHVEQQLVGCATAIPLRDETENCQRPFLEQGIAPGSIFYFGESVLIPEYRGLGVGHAFFDHREAAARDLEGITHCAFCAVVRTADDPRRPANARSLEEFWCTRGYQPSETLCALFRWREIGAAEETEKPMQFWLRKL
jgi:GNAT superfamily N-acetyltransferase